MSSVSPYSDLGLFRRLLDLARPYRLPIAGIFLIGLLSTPLALLAPVPLAIAVDSVLGPHPLPGVLDSLVPDGASDTVLLLVAVTLLLVVAVLTQLQEYAAPVLSTWTGEKLVLDFRSRLFRHLQRLSFSYADQKGVADLLFRLQYDAPSIQRVVIDGVIPFFTAGVMVAAMIFVTARIDWQLSLVAMAVAPALFTSLALWRPRIRRRSREVKDLDSAAFSVVQEVLSALRVVKAFGQEDREQGRFEDRSLAGLRGRVRLLLAEGAFGLVVTLIMAGGTSAVLYIGVRHVESGVITLGELLLILGYLAQLYSPLKTMSRKAAGLQNALAGAERAFLLFDEAPDVAERPNARALKRSQGAVVFRNVDFSYHGGNIVLHRVNLEVEPGATVGISGATGAGKTTLVSLLMRFYDPTAGAILLDGVDLRDYRLADLRHQYAIVLQDPILFSASIAENIAYARPEARDEEVVAAASAAGIHNFITSLPRGYETPVGDRGVLLSGGERQRIALARAFLKDAPLLVLDEPTSSVDVGTEATIIEALRDLSAGRTTFLIAHRLSTLELCDTVIRVEDGHVVEAAVGREVHTEPPATAGLGRGNGGGLEKQGEPVTTVVRVLGSKARRDGGDGSRRQQRTVKGGNERRDWSDLHGILARIPEGRWTTYGDLATVIDSRPSPVGAHLRNHDGCPNPHRVLDRFGRAVSGPSNEGTDPAEILEGEGVHFGEDGRADPEQRLGARALRSLLPG